jgi:DMSO/TMAO reductase YedYZ heme-binding membrane subunit
VGVWSAVTSASGIVATILLVAALGGGLLFSARATGARRRPNWWLDLHNFLGGLAFAFTVVHVLASMADRLNGIGVVQVLVPMTASGWAWGITWGVLATYAFAAVVFTSWPSKRLSRRRWLVVHLLSIPATVVVAAHAWMVGSDRGHPWFPALLALLAGLAVYPGVLRLFSIGDRRRAREARRTAAARVTATAA